MKNIFPGYYRPTEEEFLQLWNECIFIPDANVLLNLYRYSSETSEELIEIFDNVKDRLWVPYQAAFEYQGNRLKVILDQSKTYKTLIEALEETASDIKKKLSEHKRHPLLDTNEIISKTDDFCKSIIDGLKRNQEEHPNLFENDNIRDTIDNIFEQRIGSPYKEQRLLEIYNEGKQRYAKEIPPGYKDVEKEDSNKRYGDLILWFQIIDKAKEDSKPIILITDDTKDDWWWIVGGKTVGPRPELIQEILTQANVGFYMYRTDQFMKYAMDHLKHRVELKAIDEVREYRERQDEKKELMKRFIKETEHLKERYQHIQNQRFEVDKRSSRLDEAIIEVRGNLKDKTNSDPDFSESDYKRYREKLDRLFTEKVELDKYRQELSKQLDEFGLKLEDSHRKCEIYRTMLAGWDTWDED